MVVQETRCSTPELTDHFHREMIAFLHENPQHDDTGDLAYLVSCGKAVQLVTDTIRRESDMDVVTFGNYPFSGYVDQRTAENYWGEMHFDPDFLKKTSYTAGFTYNQTDYMVEIVHPAILLIQKASAVFYTYAGVRGKDLFDISALQQAFRDKKDPYFETVLQDAIPSVPGPYQADVATYLHI